MDQSALLPSPGRKRGKRRRSQMACRNPQPQLFDQARGDKGFLQTGRRNDYWRMAGEGRLSTRRCAGGWNFQNAKRADRQGAFFRSFGEADPIPIRLLKIVGAGHPKRPEPCEYLGLPLATSDAPSI